MGHTKIVNVSLSIAAGVHILILSVLFLLNKLNITTLAYLTIIPYAIMLLIRIYGIVRYRLWNYNQEGI